MTSPENLRPTSARTPLRRLEFMQRVAEGDAAAQSEFIALVERRVRTIAMAILGHPQDAEDATQNALLELLRSARTYRGDGLLAWSDRIAARTSARHARNRRVRAAQTQSAIDTEQLSVQPRHSHLNAIPRPMLDYLEELPEAPRTALVMRHVLEYTVKEIADLTETPENTVKDRLLRARQQLRRRIRQDIAVLPSKEPT